MKCGPPHSIALTCFHYRIQVTAARIFIPSGVAWRLAPFFSGGSSGGSGTVRRTGRPAAAFGAALAAWASSQRLVHWQGNPSMQLPHRTCPRASLAVSYVQSDFPETKNSLKQVPFQKQSAIATWFSFRFVLTKPL